MRLLLLLLSASLCACGGETSDEESSGDTIGAEIAEDYQNQMDKARDVEQQLLDSKDAIDAAVDGVEEEVDD